MNTNYETVVELMRDFLKEKSVCSSSIKSHMDCYTQFKRFIDEEGLTWCRESVAQWLIELKGTINSSLYYVRCQYMWQLLELEATGTVADSHLYLIRSSYERLGNCKLRDELDQFLSVCCEHYTPRSLQLARNCISEALLFFADKGCCALKDISYSDLIQFCRWEYFSSENRRATYLGHMRRLFTFSAGQGNCPSSYVLLLDDHYAMYVGELQKFSREHKETIQQLTGESRDFSTADLWTAIEDFLDIIKERGYSYTVQKNSRQALITLYLFLDLNGLGYQSEISRIWSSEVKALLPRSWRSWRRALALFDQYTQYGDILPRERFTYRKGVLDYLPDWCVVPIQAYLSQLERSFHEQGTVRTYRYPCARFCRFIVDHGCKQFEDISLELISEFCNTDPHSTFVGKASSFVVIKQFILFLEEQGYISNPNLHLCIDAGTAPYEKVVDILSEDQISAIEKYRAVHDSPLELRSIAMVLVGLKMGLRASDVLNLKFRDIDWTNQTITILQYKTKASLKLPMPIEVGNALYNYVKRGRPNIKSDFVFIRHKAPYGQLTSKICTKSLYRILPERALVNGGGFHVTRRTFATMLLRNGAGSQRVMDALGHRDPTSVMKYLSMDEERMRECPLSLAELGIVSGERGDEGE